MSPDIWHRPYQSLLLQEHFQILSLWWHSPRCIQETCNKNEQIFGTWKERIKKGKYIFTCRWITDKDEPADNICFILAPSIVTDRPSTYKYVSLAWCQSACCTYKFFVARQLLGNNGGQPWSLTSSWANGKSGMVEFSSFLKGMISAWSAFSGIHLWWVWQVTEVG